MATVYQLTTVNLGDQVVGHWLQNSGLVSYCVGLVQNRVPLIYMILAGHLANFNQWRSQRKFKKKIDVIIQKNGLTVSLFGTIYNLSSDKFPVNICRLWWPKLQVLFYSVNLIWHSMHYFRNLTLSNNFFK